MHDCFDGGVCGDDGMGPEQGGGGRGEPSGGGAGGEGGSFAGNGAGGAGGSVEPAPGGDLLGQFSAALDRLYSSLCDCQEVAHEECRAGYEEARACQLAGLEASIHLAEPWLHCAVGALSEQADCIAAAACDPDRIIGCVSPNSADQDPITAKCGEGPAELEQQDDLCSDMLPTDTGFPCFDGSGQVAAELVCDGVTHCIDGSDEMVCEPSGDEDSYACGDGEQIDIDWVCDGEVDCTNGSDEADCETVEPGPGPDPAISCGDGSSVPLAWVCDGTPDCATGADEVDCAQAP